ncbi:tyrosine-type recombinase/integrase [Nocardioides sp. LHD-245]|uniref:tyrosine-type recombinase/integrase n=1 Tax=Nocardioides sp. LHD-245 TaxID=3051387 RepID=UPI0027DF90FB|nr:tyrosine-type recombinase/integrase [Nocardioides sp. LHD-245]
MNSSAIHEDAETAVPPPLVLITTDPDVYRDTLGRAHRRRRTRIGHVRPGLPADPRNDWHRAVTTWSDALGEPQRAATGGRPRRADGKLSEHTRDLYLRHVGWLAGDHADRSPWSLDAHDLARWIDRQIWSLSTRRKVVVSVRAFYAWAVRADLAAVSPLAGVSVTPPARPGPARAELPEAWQLPIADWITWLRAAARTDTTIRTRREHLGNLASLHADPWDVTEGDLARWLSGELAPATVRARRSSVRSFYAWAVRGGHMASDPSGALDPVRQRRALPRPTPTPTLRAAHARADDRVRLALSLALYAGLRRAEIAGLHTRDIHENALHVLGKGGHERMVPLHPELASMLRDELARRRVGTDPGRGWNTQPAVDGWLFPGRNPDVHITPRWLGTLVGRSLGPGWTTHTIRHRFATQAYAAERDLRAVQELLGHSKPETTARYAAVPDGALNGAVLGVSL